MSQEEYDRMIHRLVDGAIYGCGEFSDEYEEELNYCLRDELDIKDEN